MSGKFLTGSQILEQRKKKQQEIQKSTNNSSAIDPGTKILMSRGMEPINYDARESKFQNQMSILNKRKAANAKKFAPSQTMSSIPKQNTIPPITINNTRKINNMHPANEDMASAIKPTATIQPLNTGGKIHFFLDNLAEKTKSLFYGMANSKLLGGKAVNNVLEADINRSVKKSNGGNYPEGFSAQGDIENKYKKNYELYKSQGYNDAQINAAKQNELKIANAQEEQNNMKSFIGLKPELSIDKADQRLQTVGNVAGDVIGMLGIGKFAGTLAGGVANPIVRTLAQRTLTGIGMGAMETASEKNSSVKDLAANTGRQALFMNAGGIASDLVGGVGSGILNNTALKNSVIAELGNQALKGAAFGAGGTAATMPTYSANERPQSKDLLSSAVAGALFEVIPGIFQTAKIGEVNKGNLKKGLENFATTSYGEYQAARATRMDNPEESIQRYDNVLKNIDDSIGALKKNRFVGADKEYNQTIDLLESLKDRVSFEKDNVINTNQSSTGKLIGENGTPEPQPNYNNPQLLSQNPVNVPEKTANVPENQTIVPENQPIVQENTPGQTQATHEEKQIYAAKMNEVIKKYDNAGAFMKAFTETGGKYTYDELKEIDTIPINSLDNKTSVNELYKKYIGGKATSFSKQKDMLIGLMHSAGNDLGFLDRHYNYFGMPKLVDMFEQAKANNAPSGSVAEPQEGNTTPSGATTPLENSTPQNKPTAFNIGDTVDTTDYGPVKIVDFDKSIYTLENKHGNQLKVGKDALPKILKEAAPGNNIPSTSETTPKKLPGGLKIGESYNVKHYGGNTKIIDYIDRWGGVFVIQDPEGRQSNTMAGAFINDIIKDNGPEPVKYGRAGKKAFKQWGENERVNVSVSNPNDLETIKWKKFFDFWYEHGLKGTDKKDLIFNLPDYAYMDFQPFLQDEIYKVGQKDAGKQEKQAAARGPEKKPEPVKQSDENVTQEIKPGNKPIETSNESNTMESEGNNVNEEPEKSPVEIKIDDLGDKIDQILDQLGGKGNGSKPISTDEGRTNVPEEPANVPSENVQGAEIKGNTGETSIQGTGKGEGGNVGVNATGDDLGASVGNGSSGNNTSSGEGTGKQPSIIEITSNPKGDDYVINSQSDLVIDNGKKTRYEQNVTAIKLMQQILKENRPATPDEQKILAKYCGWGGIAEAFTTDSEYNSGTKKWEYHGVKGWEKEYEDLKTILTPEEYQAAHETILNAHYTSVEVIKGMYEGLQHLGYKGGKILEPSAGIGNFIGSMPQGMKNQAKIFTGIEIDTVTGNIAKLLYPNADFRIQGFEKTKLPDGFYDIAIGNVPFGKIKINDSKYPNTITRAIHNYFFAKTLDVVRPGGLIMYITSSHTLDSQDTSGIRAFIKAKADVIGAIRLPNTAFKENAGTQVTTDILILKVREKNTPYSGEPFMETKPYNMVQKYNENDKGFPTVHPLNEYYIEHPENMLGELQFTKDMYGSFAPSLKGDGRDLKQGIIDAINKMDANVITYPQTKTPVQIQHEADAERKKASSKTRNGSFEISDGKVYINSGGTLVPANLKPKEEGIVKGLIEIKTLARDLLDLQRTNGSSNTIAAKRKQLNTKYDNFVKKNGFINKPTNSKLMADDPDIYFLLSLENYDKKTKTATKTDIFTKNKVTPLAEITHADTTKDALLISLNEFGDINMNRITSLTGKGEQEIVSDLTGLIYKNPKTEQYETADAYLSGNVRAKLKEAEAMAIADTSYKANVEALKQVMPKDKTASEISIRLGSSLVSNDSYEVFTKHLFGDNSKIQIARTPMGDFVVKEVGASKYETVKNKNSNIRTWGIDRVHFKGLDILEKILNNTNLVVKDTFKDADGNKVRVVNSEQTALVQEIAEKMKSEFMSWLSSYDNGKELQKIVDHVNEVYNTDVLRQYDGSHCTFPGMNPDIHMNPWQKDAAWRCIASGGNTMLGHEVGAGKTFEMAAAMMEMRRLGIANKPMLVVPNNIVEQWGEQFKLLYPAAKILIPGKNDYTKNNRKVLMNKIAVGDYDCVIVPESQFTKIEMSEDTITKFYNDYLQQLMEALEIEKAQAQANGEQSSLTEKRIMAKIKNTRTAMEKKLTSARSDENIPFEQLGVDALFVDEAHRFKNLMYVTKLQVSGLGKPDGSAKAFNLLMKVRHLQQLNGGRGIVFATATPVLNSISEIYNWQQYLAPDALRDRDIHSFDSWVSVFGKIEDITEVKPEGNGFRTKQGFSRLTNIGQLVQMFREFTDIKTQDMLHLNRPTVKGGKYEAIQCKQSKWLKRYMTELGERADAIHNGHVDSKVDNMLKITSDGRKAALDPRLVDPGYVPEPGEPPTKVEVAVYTIYKNWLNTKKEKLTHLVFLELSTPKGKDTSKDDDDEDEENTDEPDAEFTSMYQDMKDRLVKKGVPANEIAFIHDAKTDVQKQELQNKFNDGQIRILIGNNEKMGVGANLQKRTKAIYHIDFPWRPKDLTQEDGRAERQGNINKEIEKYVFVTEGSFDARLWDNLQRKLQFIDDLMTSDVSMVEVEDIGVQALSYQEVVGVASNNPLMKEQVQLTQEIQQLHNLEKGYIKRRNEYAYELAEKKSALEWQSNTVEKLKADMPNIVDTRGDLFKITFNGKDYTDRKKVDTDLWNYYLDNKDLIKEEGARTNIKCDFAGIINKLTVGKELFGRIFYEFHSKNNSYTVYVTPDDEKHIVEKLANKLRDLPDELEITKRMIPLTEKEIKDIELAMGDNFPHAEKLAKLVSRQNEIMNILNPPDVQRVSGDDTEDDSEDAMIPWQGKNQEITSSETSINKDKLPATFSRVKFEPGTRNADIGGGKFDNATEFLKQQEVENVIYDPFNRTYEHNIAAINKLRGGQADTATINNVLNVIKEPEAREQVIANACDSIKENGTAYFLIYEGSGNGIGKETPKGWQENKKAEAFIPEIKNYFNNVTRKGNMLVAKEPIKDNVMFDNSIENIDNLSSLNNGGPTLGKATGQNATGEAKRASEIVSEFANKLNAAIKSKHRGSSLGTFNNQTYIIRIKKANDIPVLSHETGHMLDRLYGLTLTKDAAIRAELIKLGQPTSTPSYTPSKVRREGIAEFTRLYLTDEAQAKNLAPAVYQYFESKVPADVLKTLKGLRKDVWQLTNLNPVERVGKSIHFMGDKEPKKGPIDVMAALRKAYAGIVDYTYPVEHAGKELNGKPGQTKLANMLSRFRGYEGISLYDLFTEQTDLNGNKVSDSYQDILGPVLKDEGTRRAFVEYQVSKRAEDYFDRGLELPDTKETYEATVQELEKQHPEFKKMFNDIRKYRENSTHLVVESGIYSEEDYNKMLQNNPNYVPLKRIMEAVNRVAGTSRSLAGAKRVVKGLHGGGQEILDPTESDINNTFIYRSVAIRNQILQQLADYADEAKGKGYIMVKSESKIKSTSFNLEQIKKALEDEGVDLTGIDLETTMRIWNPNYLAGPNQIVIYREGKPVLYDVNPEIYSAVANLSPTLGNAFTRAMMSIANVTKTGIIFTPKYLIYNTARDTFQNLIASESGINILDVLKGFGDAIFHGSGMRLAESKGGTVNHFAAGDRKFAQEAINDMMAGKSAARKFKNTIKHPFRSFQDLIEPTEMGGRIAELKKYLEKNGYSDENIEQAITNMRRISIDFRRVGGWTKKYQVNRFTNFLNSSIQGVDSTARIIYKHPVRTLLKSLLYLTLPTLLLMLMNKDNKKYRELPWYRKDFFFNIPIGDPKTAQYFVPIPKPWELGVLFSALPERMIWKIKEHDPHAFEEFMSTLKQAFVPEVIPSAVQPLLQDYGGVKWNGTPILNASDANVSPYMQYNEYTSETSKAIARALKNVPLGSEKNPLSALKSPKRLDNLIQGYTGTLGSVGLESVDVLAGKKEGIPVIGGLTNNFVVDAYRNPQSINDFYNNKQTLDTLYSDTQRMKKQITSNNPDYESATQLPAKDELLRQVYNKTYEELNNYNSLKQAIQKSKEFTAEKKDNYIKAINEKMIDITSTANRLFDKNRQ